MTENVHFLTLESSDKSLKELESDSVYLALRLMAEEYALYQKGLETN